MKLAIMQPYLFPYIGYFQLIRAVDTFVVYDDVNFIKGGWINRNFFLANGEKSRFTLELLGASSNVLINQVSVGRNRLKLCKSIKQAYSKAPEFGAVFPIVESIIMNEEEGLAKYINNGLQTICSYLSLCPDWHISSDLNKNNELSGQDKVLDICKSLGADHYINVPGGKELYNQESFAAQGIELSFIHPDAIEYKQFGKSFVPDLSILDVMMFNDKDQCSKLLQEYSFV